MPLQLELQSIFQHLLQLFQFLNLEALAPNQLWIGLKVKKALELILPSQVL